MEILARVDGRLDDSLICDNPATSSLGEFGSEPLQFFILTISLQAEIIGKKCTVTNFSARKLTLKLLELSVLNFTIIGPLRLIGGGVLEPQNRSKMREI